MPVTVHVRLTGRLAEHLSGGTGEAALCDGFLRHSLGQTLAEQGRAVAFVDHIQPVVM